MNRDIPNPNRFPRWIKLPTGQDMVVQDHRQMSALMGEEYDCNAEKLVGDPPTPDSEPVLKLVDSVGADPDRSSISDPTDDELAAQLFGTTKG